jgi:Protein of unknown function (DUF3016)
MKPDETRCNQIGTIVLQCLPGSLPSHGIGVGNLDAEASMRLRFLTAAALLTLSATASHSGGVAEVSFPNEARYTDAGAYGTERAANLAQLAAHLKRLAQRDLPEGQKLTVEILDVDLAGEARPWRRMPSEVRVLRGRADWPRIELRYTLSGEPGNTRSATESIADLNYLQRIGSYGSSEPLVYEKRMIDDWFRARFVERGSAH